jgi:hypothetical protein
MTCAARTSTGTPTKNNPGVIARLPKDVGDDADTVRELRAFHGGLLPNLNGARFIA